MMISDVKDIIKNCNIALSSNYRDTLTKEENDTFLNNLNSAYNLLIELANNQ